MSELNVAVHISFKRIQRVGIELRDIAANFEKQGVAVLESSLDQLLVLVVLSHDLSITRVSRQVDGQGDKFFSDDWLRAVDDELVDNGDALCVRECCLKLIFLGHVVEELEDESAETRRFQNLYELRNHTCVIDLITNLSIKRKVEEQAECNLEKQLVVAGNESIEFINNIALFHLNLVLAKDTKLL